MKKKNKLRGFTLVEVMTSLVIMVILIAIASGVIITTFNIFGRNALFRAAQNNGNNVYNFIYDHLSYVTALKIDETVDINTKDSLSFIDKDDLKVTVAEGSETVEIIPYYEKMKIGSESMILQRKNITEPFYIYGNKSNENSMNGCVCTVTFSKYEIKTDPDNPDIKIYPDTIEFAVEISRYGETYYSRSGSIPILNETAKSHIYIPNEISCKTNEFEILYTYLH
ncbi:MAG: PilW family protein [Oscillospiraceae bacterium]|nr:type II secretion system protein [Oscillospiraceae bacterium]